MKYSIVFLLVVILFFFLMFKAIKFLFPFMIPVLIFFGIYLFLSSFLGSKKQVPPQTNIRREVVKEVEIRVVDEKEPVMENSIKKENG